MSFKMPFNPAKSFKVGNRVSFECGGKREGIVTDIQPQYFIIGHAEAPDDPLKQWIFYAAKDYSNMTHVVVISH